MAKDDLRIVKTKKALYETLLKLLAQKPFEEIKVSDICEEALVNRSTFYAHFSDKYELLAQYIEVLKESLLNELNTNEHISNTRDYYLKMLEIFLNHAESHQDIYRPIMQNNRNNVVLDMAYSAFNNALENSLKQIETDKKEHIPSSFVSQFYLGAILGICMGLVANPQKYTKEEILSYLNKLIPEDLYINA